MKMYLSLYEVSYAQWAHTACRIGGRDMAMDGGGGERRWASGGGRVERVDVFRDFNLFM